MFRGTLHLLLIPLGCATHLQNYPPWWRLKGDKQAEIKVIWEQNFTIQSHSAVGARLHVWLLHFLYLPSRSLHLGSAELVAEQLVHKSSFQLSSQREFCTIGSLTHSQKVLLDLHITSFSVWRGQPSRGCSPLFLCPRGAVGQCGVWLF